MTNVICIGLAVSDLIYSVSELPDGEGKTHAHSLSQTGGGPAATAAVAVSRLGGKAKLIAPIGDDLVGDAIVKELREENVDVGGIRRLPGVSSPQSSITVDDVGSRMIVNYSDARLFREAAVPDRQELESADSVLVDVRWPEGAAAALRWASGRGVPAIVDFDAGFDQPDDLLAHASHIVFAENALVRLTSEADPRAALLSARRRTDAFLGVTLGDQGCLWLDNGDVEHLAAFDVDVIDTTGAGDVFHGAFAWAMASGNDEATSMRIASAAAALSCGGSGGRAGIPSGLELSRFLEANT